MQHVVETAVITFIMTHHTMHAQDSRGQWRMGAAMGIGPAKTPLLTSSQGQNKRRVVTVIVVSSMSPLVCNYFSHLFPSAD